MKPEPKEGQVWIDDDGEFMLLFRNGKDTLGMIYLSEIGTRMSAWDGSSKKNDITNSTKNKLRVYAFNLQEILTLAKGAIILEEKSNEV